MEKNLKSKIWENPKSYIKNRKKSKSDIQNLKSKIRNSKSETFNIKSKEKRRDKNNKIKQWSSRVCDSYKVNACSNGFNKIDLLRDRTYQPSKSSIEMWLLRWGILLCKEEIPSLWGRWMTIVITNSRGTTEPQSPRGLPKPAQRKLLLYHVLSLSRNLPTGNGNGDAISFHVS